MSLLGVCAEYWIGFEGIDGEGLRGSMAIVLRAFTLISWPGVPTSAMFAVPPTTSDTTAWQLYFLVRSRDATWAASSIAVSKSTTS
jgi:hypothetical protein